MTPPHAAWLQCRPVGGVQGECDAGSQLWVKQRGMCHWPVVMWSLDLCMRKDLQQLLESYKDGGFSPAPFPPNLDILHALLSQVSGASVTQAQTTASHAQCCTAFCLLYARWVLLQLSTHAGHLIVRFYGEHSSMWVAPEQLTDLQPEHEDHEDRLRAVKTHPKMKHK